MCDDHDPPTVYSRSVHRSRKPRKCCECWTPIAIGDRYENVFGVWDGEARSFATCIPCSELRDIMDDADMCPLLGILDDCVGNFDAGPLDEIDAFRKRIEVVRAAKFGVMSIAPPRACRGG